jgi:uncharacterized protein (DUF58 family)
MISSELFRKIRRIEITTRHLVADSFAGEYHAIFKGRGMAFDEVRPYQPGDEIRSIDWNVTARTGEPYVKRFIEERELTVLLVVDGSASLGTGRDGRQDRDLAAELAAVLAFAATTNNDRVGLIQFSDRIERVIPPRKGRRHVLRLLRDLLTAPSREGGTDVGAALDLCNHLLKRKAIVFLISDFAGPARPDRYRSSLVATARRHDLIALELRDPLLDQLPELGLLWLTDAETGQRIALDSRDPASRDALQRAGEADRAARRRAFLDAGVDRVVVPVAGDYVPALSAFFARRSSRMARR